MDRSRFPARRIGRLVVFSFLMTLLATGAFAQYQTGNIYGTVVDKDGAAVPGVTVTVSGVGAPQVFVTDSAGKFRFLNLSPGAYDISAELSGFGTVNRSGLEVNVGANTNVTLQLNPAVEQTITVTAETPLLDTRKTGTGATVTRVELEEVPTARDPWVVLQQVPGVLVDRINIGGNESGQQSNYVGKGASGDQATWNVDGVNITDMAAVGSSPTYYDFDSFEEMQATTGGTDPRIMTPGVQLNMVTKRGTNEWRGSGRYFVTDNEFQEEATVPSEAEFYLARANEIDHIDDMGFEVGGPIIKDRLWIWGAWSDQQIDLLTAMNKSASGVITGGAFDKTTLENLNGKLNAQITSNNSGTFLYTNGDKIKQGRNVGPLRPPGTGWNQAGPTDLFKLEDTHIFGPSFYLTGLASKVEGGFHLTPQNGRENDMYFDEDGVAHVSYYHYESDRPQENYRLDASSFFDTGSMNHELKFGFGYRDTPTTSLTAWPGTGNYIQFLDGNFGLAYLTRAGAPAYGTEYTDLYIGDTMLLGNLTIQAGLRYDIQKGSNVASTSAANPTVPDLLPELVFGGDSEELEWTTIAPRIGATYSFGTTRRTVVRGAYNRYVDQLSAGTIAPGNPLYSFQGLLYYMEDLNGDNQVQYNEILFDDGLYSFYGLDPANPASPISTRRLDYDMDPPTTDEFILGFEHELLPEFTVGANYTHRQFNDFLWSVYEREQGSGDYFTSADYVLGTPVTVTAPDGQQYSLNRYTLAPGNDATFSVVTNRPDYKQIYDGLEFNATKRLSNRWMMRANVSWNDWKQEVGEDGLGSYNRLSGIYYSGDPTVTLTPSGCSNCDDELVVEGSGTGSGAKGAVYINSRWSYNLTGLYQLPWDITVGAAVTGREGYPLPWYVRSGDKNLLVDGVDPVRMEDVFNLDLRLAKDFNFPAGIGLTISADMFNVTDERTILQRQHRQSIGTTNQILELQSPRVFRLGGRITF